VVRRWELDAPPPGIYMAAADLDSRVRKLAAAERKREGRENVLRERKFKNSSVFCKV
jgi:hypothetical protein